MRLLQLSCDLQTLNLALIYCYTNLNFVHINLLCLSQVIFQDFLLKDQFPVPVYSGELTLGPHGDVMWCQALNVLQPVRFVWTGHNWSVVQVGDEKRGVGGAEGCWVGFGRNV